MRAFFSKNVLLSIFMIILTSGRAVGQESPYNTPKSHNIAKIDQLINRYVEQKKVAGVVAYLNVKGKDLLFKAYGVQDEKGNAMATNSIFRLASMTKPITTVATMLLVERGQLSVSDKVSDYLQAFSKMKVMVSGRKQNIQRPLTIHDLLTHTSGMASGFESSSSDAMIRSERISSYQSLEEYVNFLATVPLVEQPGTRFIYAHNTDVLARIVEVVSGQSFDKFLTKNIFNPLNMMDAGYKVNENQQERLTAVYLSKDSLRVATQSSQKYSVLPMGNSGLVATIEDYSHFAKMLLSGGIYNGKRIIKEATLNTMLINYLSADALPFEGGETLDGIGFGYGFAIDTDNQKRYKTVAQRWANLPKGSYWWPGGFRTYFWVEPQNETVVLLFTQTPGMGHQLVTEFIDAIYTTDSK